jgi:hypothetical protein
MLPAHSAGHPGNYIYYSLIVPVKTKPQKIQLTDKKYRNNFFERIKEDFSLKTANWLFFSVP